MRSTIFVGIILLVSSCMADEPVQTFEGQLTKQVKEIDNYLLANPVDPSKTVVRDASGIRLVILEQGTGTFPPNTGNNLKVVYTGRLLSNGAVFDSGELPFKLSDSIINGWKIGLGLMTQGTRATLYIPAVWAYGTKGQGSIPPNANLVFDMYLTNVVPTQPQLDKVDADIATIDEYLTTNEIVAQTHPSGIRYVMTQEGSAKIPNLYSGVKIKFKAKTLDGEVIVDEALFEPNSSFSSRVVNYPHGAIVGLQLLGEGGKATFYVPSVLAYGLQGAPAGDIVVFEIELLEIISE